MLFRAGVLNTLSASGERPEYLPNLPDLPLVGALSICAATSSLLMRDPSGPYQADKNAISTPAASIDARVDCGVDAKEPSTRPDQRNKVANQGPSSGYWLTGPAQNGAGSFYGDCQLARASRSFSRSPSCPKRGIPLGLGLANTARFPIAIEVHHGRDHCTENTRPPALKLAVGAQARAAGVAQHYFVRTNRGLG
jgi:hypothetical protein